MTFYGWKSSLHFINYFMRLQKVYQPFLSASTYLRNKWTCPGRCTKGTADFYEVLWDWTGIFYGSTLQLMSSGGRFLLSCNLKSYNNRTKKMNTHIQGVPSISTHLWFQFLTFLIVVSKNTRFAIKTQMV